MDTEFESPLAHNCLPARIGDPLTWVSDRYNRTEVSTAMWPSGLGVGLQNQLHEFDSRHRLYVSRDITARWFGREDEGVGFENRSAPIRGTVSSNLTATALKGNKMCQLDGGVNCPGVHCVTVGDNPSDYGGTSTVGGYNCSCGAWVLYGTVHHCHLCPTTLLPSFWPATVVSSDRWGAGTCPACGYLNCTMSCGCTYEHQIRPCDQHGLASQSE